MGNYILAGLIAGSILWWSKFILATIVLPRNLSKWLHNNPIGILTMDITLTYLALHIIQAAGANGLTVLFVLIFYGMWTMLCMIKYIIKKKTKQLYHSII